MFIMIIEMFYRCFESKYIDFFFFKKINLNLFFDFI